MGITSGIDTVEAWPYELSFDCRTINDKRNVSVESFNGAAKFADEWIQATNENSALAALESAMTDAPKLSSCAQSILHIWTALESIFPPNYDGGIVPSGSLHGPIECQGQ